MVLDNGVPPIPQVGSCCAQINHNNYAEEDKEDIHFRANKHKYYAWHEVRQVFSFSVFKFAEVDGMGDHKSSKYNSEYCTKYKMWQSTLEIFYYFLEPLHRILKAHTIQS